MLQRITTFIITLGLCLALAGCIKAYQIPIQQGNIITPTSAEKIHTGMTPHQVTAILGQPVMDNIYADDLIYVYTYDAGKNSATIKKKLVITFRNNKAISIDQT